jgi:hypothetical protein
MSYKSFLRKVNFAMLNINKQGRKYLMYCKYK